MLCLNLHGVRHSNVYNVVEDYILLTTESTFKIVTGNSNKMLELVVEVLSQYGFNYRFETWWNIGAIIAYEE